jgi:polyphenol oxidase
MNSLPEAWIQPSWSGTKVLAGSTTREGGCSKPPFDTFNIRFGEDDPAAVTANRQRLKELTGAAEAQYLEQVHGIDVLAATRLTAAHPFVGDAMWTTEADLALVIQTADCLPVLIAERGGRCIGAAHAGWRGLASGVIPALLAAMPCRRAEMLVWLGPCISRGHTYEVGSEVRQAFVHTATEAVVNQAFRPGRSTGKWWCDLVLLARAQLEGAGVPAGSITDSGRGTLDDPALYSYRREARTGRMAHFIVRR